MKKYFLSTLILCSTSFTACHQAEPEQEEVNYSVMTVGKGEVTLTILFCIRTRAAGH